MVSLISSFYNYTIVLMAGALTFAVVVGLTIYAFYTKTDFTVCGGLMFILLMVLIVAGILAIFIRSEWFGLMYSIFGTIVFGLYLIMDT